MSAKIVLKNDLINKIPHMSGKQYSEILELAIGNIIKYDENLKKFSVCRRSQYHKYLLYIPVYENGIKITENEEQRVKRLELRDSLINKFSNTGVQTKLTDVMDYSKYISRNIVVDMLNISKKHLDVIASSTGVIKSVIYKNNKFIEKESLLLYLSQNHFTGTGVTNYQIIDGLIGGNEYIEAWEKFLNVVPENKRVVKETDVSEEFNSEDIFNIFNIYVRIIDETLTEVPKLYPLNMYVKNFNLDHRSLLRYCEKGIINYYKIGNKYMLSEEDYNNSFELIKKYKDIPINRIKIGGKKTKYQQLLFDIDIPQLIPNKKFEQNMKPIVVKYFDLCKIKKEILKLKEYYMKNNYDKLTSSIDKQDLVLNYELEKLINSIKEKALEVL
ncbi:hypothetical protein [Clostridium sp.]|uniref:hypothetical protein n=1 Tax=Clostridium sp. TaxID=1506 RepID=UPI001A39EE23|nr:hypothetical protein [Clostridium sp.]MBK5240554.1 hypothetical protein [Clostridium sp.]